MAPYGYYEPTRFLTVHTAWNHSDVTMTSCTCADCCNYAPSHPTPVIYVEPLIEAPADAWWHDAIPEGAALLSAVSRHACRPARALAGPRFPSALRRVRGRLQRPNRSAPVRAIGAAA